MHEARKKQLNQIDIHRRMKDLWTKKEKKSKTFGIQIFMH